MPRTCKSACSYDNMIMFWVKLYLIWRGERRGWGGFKPLKMWWCDNKKWEVGETMERRKRKSSNIIAYGWVNFNSKVHNHNSLGKAK